MAVKGLAITLITTAVVEFGIMVMLGFTSQRPYLMLHSLVDSLVPVVVLCPVVYIFCYKPLRRQAAARCWAERERDRFLALSSDLLCIIGFDGRIRRVNPSIENLLGLPADRFLSHRLDEFLHPDDRQPVVAAVESVARGEMPPSRHEARVLDRNGSCRWIQWRSSVDFYNGLIYSTGRDVTQHRLADQALREDRDKLEVQVSERSAELAKTNSRTKNIEEMLRESEDRYQKLVDSAPDAILVHCEGDIVFANFAAARLLGAAEPAQLVGIRVHEIVHPDFRAIVDERLRTLRQGATTLPVIEAKLLKLDGTPVDVEAASAAVTYNGRPAMQSVARNNTERKAVMEALRDSERRYRELANSLPQPVFESDENGLITFANQSALVTFGYTDQDIRAGQNLFHMVEPSQVARAKEDFGKCLAGERHVSEYDFLARDGRTFSGIAFCTAIVRSGEAVGLRGVVVDITDRKRAEAELRRLRSEWEAVFQSIGDPTMILDADHRILAANKATCRALDTSEERLKGKHCYEVLHGKNAPPHGCPMVLAASGIEQAVEIEVEGLDGTCLVRCTPTPCVEGQGQKFIHIATNITELKRGEEQLRASVESLELTLEATVRAMALTVETRDPYTAGHQRRVATLASSIAQEMGLPAEQNRLLQLAAIIHDIGKIGVPAEILSKPGRLSEAEFQLMRDHPQVGYDILSTIAFPWPLADIVRQHHERMDGSGYPAGLSGTDILLEARVIAVADVVEAMASHRPYRPARGIDEAIDEISSHRGTLYDSRVVDACVKVIAANPDSISFEERKLTTFPVAAAVG